MVGGVRARYHEIRSMSGRYASYWNAFFLLLRSCPFQLTDVRVNNAFNDFIMLANTQFVENASILLS